MSKKVDAKRILDATLGEISRVHGSGTAMVMGKAKVETWKVISSGSLTIDIVTGVGGFPRGRMTELFGPEQGGKSTSALQLIASGQSEGLQCAFIDAEHALDVKYASALGVDIPSLVLSQPDCGEQALDVCERLVRSNVVGIIVVDSVAALTPKAEIEGEYGDSHMGLQARLMGQAMRKLTHVVKTSECALVFINQIREKVGIAYGNPEVTTGGRALKFYSSLRIEIRRKEMIKDGNKNIGSVTKIKTIKNRGAAPFQERDGDLIFGKGFYRPNEVLDLGVEFGVLEKAGSWYSAHGERLGGSKAIAADFLAQNPGLMGELSQEILRKALPHKFDKGATDGDDARRVDN